MGSRQSKQTYEALLEQPAIRPAPEDCKGCGRSLLTLIGFGFLTFNSAMAVYRSNGDLSAISFVVFSYLDLVLLFYCLRLYERTPLESTRREHLKMAVWLLTTMLTAAFSYKVAAIMPFPVQVLVWTMAGVTVLGGFYAFLHSDEVNDSKHSSCTGGGLHNSRMVKQVPFGRDAEASAGLEKDRMLDHGLERQIW